MTYGIPGKATRMKLRDKVAIVTGAGRGIGRAIAIAFGREETNVVAASRTLSEVSDTAKEIEALGRRCLPLKADISSRDDVEDKVYETLERFGRIDILVNNARMLGLKLDGLTGRLISACWTISAA
jgi:NAD(P)-dependent dehydrogenase (short-subunit alcohol dehydrogenase family)